MNRSTKTKACTVAVLQEAGVPLRLSDVHTRVREHLPKTAYSTVYRIVGTLVREKKVVRIDWRERGSRLEWAEKSHHHHLVCTSCGDVADISDSALTFNARTVTEKTGFRVEDHSIELFGTCAPCTK